MGEWLRSHHDPEHDDVFVKPVTRFLMRIRASDGPISQ